MNEKLIQLNEDNSQLHELVNSRNVDSNLAHTQLAISEIKDHPLD